MKNKVIIITGASSGIGKAMALDAANRGAKVVLAARSEDKLQVVKQNITEQGGDAMTIKCDVTNEDDCKRMVDLTLQKYGKIDVLINNAGISMRAILEEAETSVIRDVMEINFFGTVNCTKHALKPILAQKGSIVGVSSIAGYKGLPGRTGYSASKFAMQGFLEALRIENMKKELHVLIACPGFTASNIRNKALGKDGNVQGETPRDEQKMMSAEEVAARILDGIEKRKNTLTMTFNGKMTVLLNKFFPKLVDKLVYNHMSKEPNSPF